MANLRDRKHGRDGAPRRVRFQAQLHNHWRRRQRVQAVPNLHLKRVVPDRNSCQTGISDKGGGGCMHRGRHQSSASKQRPPTPPPPPPTPHQQHTPITPHAPAQVRAQRLRRARPRRAREHRPRRRRCHFLAAVCQVLLVATHQPARDHTGGVVRVRLHVHRRSVVRPDQSDRVVTRWRGHRSNIKAEKNQKKSKKGAQTKRTGCW